MATKRKSVLPADLDLDDLRAAPGAGRPQPAFHEAPPAPVVPAAAETGSVDLKTNAVNMSIYLLPGDHRRLRRLAADEDTSIQALVLDGIDRVLAERGQEPVGRWATRRKAR